MKILLDECVNWRLKREFREHEVQSVAKLGWTSLKNGKLLTRAQEEFDVIITTDKNIPNQQNLSQYRLGIIVLRAYRTKLENLLPLVPRIKDVLKTIKKGELVTIHNLIDA